MTDSVALNQPSLDPSEPRPSEPGSIAPGSVRAWLMASRPKTLTAAVAPVLVGTAVASHSVDLSPGPVVATLLGAGLLQIASNFANDVFDHEKGADTEARLGPTRSVQAGLVSPGQMKRALVVTLLLSLLVGVYLTAVAGWPIIVIGLFSMASAVAYTGGPYPLGYHGLGDVFVMLFFGFVAVCGTVFVHVGSVPSLGYLCAIPVGALITNILVVNNLRDRHTDVRAGKKTLAVRFGRRGAEVEYIGLCVVAYGVPLGLAVLSTLGPMVLLPLATLPLALRNTAAVLREEGTALNLTLVATAKLVFLFGLTFAAGIFGARFLG